MPTDAGQQLQESLLAYQRFLESCGSLLRAADRWLTGDPIRLFPGATSYCMPSAGSSSIAVPQRWITDVLLRVYTTPSHPDVMVWVSILLLPDPKPGWPNHGEPLVSAGWLRAQGDNLDPYKHLVAGRTFWATQHRPDGSFAEGVWPETKGGAASLRVMAVPLVDIEDDQALEREVLAPLVSELRSKGILT